MQELGKRQARVLDQLVAQDSQEAPTDAQVEQMLQDTVSVLFGGSLPERKTAEPPSHSAGAQDGSRARQGQDQNAASSEPRARHADAPAALPDAERTEPELSARDQDTSATRAPSKGPSAPQALGAEGSAAAEAAPHEPAPVGMRTKRSVIAPKENDSSQPAKNPLKRGPVPKGGAQEAEGAPVVHSSGASKHADVCNGSTLRAPAAVGPLSACRLCGVEVDRATDVFIAWSEHIRACDEQEAQAQSDEEDVVRQ